jgi:hypothetical protein
MIPRIGGTAALVVALLAGAALPALAQLDANLGALSGDNAKGYLGPLPKALSGTLNTAIFRSGHVAKAGPSISIGIYVMGVNFDDKDRRYTPTDPPGFTGTGQIQAPTVIGDTHAVTQPGQGGTTLYHPGGFDLGHFALAVPQLSIGSIFGTRAIVRYIKVDFGDTDFGKLELFGIGGQHSISQYVPGLPVDVAAGFFYQKFKIHDDLLDTKAYSANVTASKKFGLLEPYVGVGYDSFDMDVAYESTTGSPGQKVSVKFDTQKNGHFTAGVTASLAFVKLNGEFNAAAEKGVAVGLNFGN